MNDAREPQTEPEPRLPLQDSVPHVREVRALCVMRKELREAKAFRASPETRAAGVCVYIVVP
eukprot:5720168-Alexandrium_andersonii.AAC.1